MNKNEAKIAQEIRAGYVQKEVTKLDELKSLDRRVRRPADVFAYTFGAIGSLVLGTGMCLAMGVIGNGLMIPGIAIGGVGIVAVSANYFMRNKILSARKRKYADQVISLSDGILNS